MTLSRYNSSGSKEATVLEYERTGEGGISKEDALELARAECDRRGWGWSAPFLIERRRTTWQYFGRAPLKDCSSFVTIDVYTGAVMRGRLAIGWRRFFAVVSTLSLALCLGICVMWARSYARPVLTSDPVTGYSAVAPPWPIPIPMPSDVMICLVLTHGHFEHWEYAEWENRWYRMSNGFPDFPAAFPVVLFSILPIVWVITAVRRRRRLTKSHAPARFANPG